MNRRSFFKMGGARASEPPLPPVPPSAFVPAHNWDGYDWGTAPPVTDRLYQGPFPQYPPEEVLPGSEVVMATTPSRAVVPGYGMGLVTYVTGDFGGNTFRAWTWRRRSRPSRSCRWARSSTCGPRGESCRSARAASIRIRIGRRPSRWRSSTASASASASR